MLGMAQNKLKEQQWKFTIEFKVTIGTCYDCNRRIHCHDHVGRPSTLLSLIKEAKQPEDGIRVASFAVMQAVAYHAWGVQVIIPLQSNQYYNTQHF